MKSTNSITKLAAALVLAAFGCMSSWADIVYVTSTCSNVSSTTICGSAINNDANPNTGEYVYSDTAAGYTSARTANVADKPLTPGARYWTTGWSNATPELPGIILCPALGEVGGVYKVFHVFSSTAQNVTLDAVLGVTNIANCTLSFDRTDKFQRSYGFPAPQQWQYLGFLTNDPGQSNPKIGFYHAGGTVNGSGGGNRLVVDTFKFVLYNDPCIDVAPVSVKTAPLVVGQTSVIVSGVTNTATGVTVYQDTGSGFQPIGTKTTDVAGGTNVVITSALVKGAKLAATQTVGGVEGCVPATSDVVVGGGANPRIRIALSVREAWGLTNGVVGEDGRAYTTNQSRIHFLGASTLLTGSPVEGKVIQPANAWQTVTFQRGPDYMSPVDPSVIWNSGTAGQVGTQNDLQGDWGTLEAIAFVIDDLSDTGPYKFYIDNIMSGTNVLEDFEGSPANESDYTFHPPRTSGSTSGYMLEGIDQQVIDNTVADTGEKSMRLAWQWASLNSINWARVHTSNSTKGKANPLFNLNEPLTFRILIQPVGATPLTNNPAKPVITPAVAGGNVVLNWNGAHRLQTTVGFSEGWTNVGQVILRPNTNTYVGPWTNKYAEPARFFRLVD